MMARIDLVVRAILDYAARRELSFSPSGLIGHRGEQVDDDSAQQVIALLDEGVLVEDGELIVPAFEPDLDEVLARYPVEVAAP